MDCEDSVGLRGEASPAGIGRYVFVEFVRHVDVAVVDVVDPVESVFPAGVDVVGVEFGSMVGVSPEAVKGCGVVAVVVQVPL